MIKECPICKRDQYYDDTDYVVCDVCGKLVCSECCWEKDNDGKPIVICCVCIYEEERTYDSPDDEDYYDEEDEDEEEYDYEDEEEY